MRLIEFGSKYPVIQEYKEGFLVPAGLREVSVDNPDGTTITTWKGYLLEVPNLTEEEFDKAAAKLPSGDYSAERLAVAQQAVRNRRREEYPPFEDYLDGIVKDDADQIAEYKARALAVKNKYPMPR